MSTFSTPTSRLPASRLPKKSLKTARIPFKSPMRREQVATVENVETLEADIAVLREKEDQLDKEIAERVAQGLKEEELQMHIDKLHEYNEVKDIAQMLIGRIDLHRIVDRGETIQTLFSGISASMWESAFGNHRRSILAVVIDCKGCDAGTKLLIRKHLPSLVKVFETCCGLDNR